MISYLRGRIVSRAPTELVIDVNGVGYAVTIPLSTYEKLQQADGQATILTYLHVREDIMQLYGFATEIEREIFRLLISVTGIGPKIAQGILSGLSTAEIREAIGSGKISALTAISGVGRKTAERICLELRDKLGKAKEPPLAATSAQLKSRSEAIIALMSLGHTRSGAEQALRQVLAEEGDLPVEEMIKRALHHASK